MSKTKRIGLLVLSSAVLVAAPSYGTVVGIFDGAVDPVWSPTAYTGTRDTTISYVAADPRYMRMNVGASSTMRVRRASTATRGMVYFDLASVGTTMASQDSYLAHADFVLNQTATSPTGGALDIYQIAPANAGWTEGAAAGFKLDCAGTRYRHRRAHVVVQERHDRPGHCAVRHAHLPECHQPDHDHAANRSARHTLGVGLRPRRFGWFRIVQPTGWRPAESDRRGGRRSEHHAWPRHRHRLVHPLQRPIRRPRPDGQPDHVD